MMDISDWTNSDVVQLLEQFSKQPTGPLHELRGKIQKITNKNVQVGNLRHHLQQFQKQITAYKQLAESKNEENAAEAKEHRESERNEPEGIAITSRSNSTVRKKRTEGSRNQQRRITPNRRRELQMLRSYQQRRRKKMPGICRRNSNRERKVNDVRPRAPPAIVWNSEQPPGFYYDLRSPDEHHDAVNELSSLLSNMMPQGNLLNQQFQSMTAQLDHCLNLLRLLRSEVVTVHCKIMDGEFENESADSGEKTLEERLDFINQIYDNLESHAKQLPTSTPMTVQMERLSRFLHDAHIDPHTKELYEKTLEASTWMETNNQLLQMYAEFLRTVVGNRRRSVMTDQPISYSNYGPNSSPQNIFEQTLATVLKDPNNKKIGLVGRYIEKSTLSAVVEFKFGQVVDKQYVCLLKMLMVVNSGLPEFVQIIAPHEEWSYMDVGDQVDIHKESRYLVYRKMSVQANIHLMQTIMPCIDIRNAHTLSYILNLFSKFSGVFDTKCRVCKKIMKDYLPPLMFDLRCPKNALHESCR